MQGEGATASRLRARRALAYAPVILTTLALGAVTAHAVVSRLGGPAAPLDDSYIHFQYARSIAELHPFQYTRGAAPTPGATSLIWPLLLAPFYAAGLHGGNLAYAAWGLGFLSLGLLAVETKRLASGIVSEGVAILAGAMTLAFGGFTWFAASSMEVVPFAWLLTLSARKVADHVQATADALPPSAASLVALSFLCPLMRPEGAAMSVAIALALAVRPRGRSRALGALALLGILAPPAVCLLFTGQAVTSTAFAKWLPLNPYVPFPLLVMAVFLNGRGFFLTLLDGRLWTSMLLPEGGAPVFLAAIPALLVAGYRTRRMPRALIVLFVGSCALIPTSYETFLVNRLRYIWPFQAAWFVAVAALSQGVGDAVDALVKRVTSRIAHAPLVFAGIATALLATKLGPSIDDLVESMRAVDMQQVSMAKWARDALPKDARIGVNDTGAVAYFGDHATFDVVGLTTRGEARYWTGGPGTRFEHYEHLPREALPTHFIVYPEWFQIDALLGDELATRSARHTILGGETMAAYVARYDALSTGELPTDANVEGRRLIDSLDVCDLESEAAHGYLLLDAKQHYDLAIESEGRVDGGRLERSEDEFSLTLRGGGLLVVRFGARGETMVRIRAGDRVLGTVKVGPVAWQEATLAVPPDVSGRVVILATALAEPPAALPTPFASLHYWSYE